MLDIHFSFYVLIERLTQHRVFLFLLLIINTLQRFESYTYVKTFELNKNTKAPRFFFLNLIVCDYNKTKWSNHFNELNRLFRERICDLGINCFIFYALNANFERIFKVKLLNNAIVIPGRLFYLTNIFWFATNDYNVKHMQVENKNYALTQHHVTWSDGENKKTLHLDLVAGRCATVWNDSAFFTR